MDWKDLTRRGRLTAWMVTPTNLDDTLGELQGVDWDTLKISAGYYTDARVSASLTIVDGNWVRGSFVRIVYEIAEWGYSRELGTFAVVNDDATYDDGAWHTELELVSMLHTMSLDLALTPLAVSRGGFAMDAARNELKAAGRAYRFIDAADYMFNSTTVYESGQSRLSRVYGFCDNADNRLDVDGHGVITISPYVRPSEKTPAATLSLTDERGVVKDGLKRSTDWLEMPTVAAVSYKFAETVNGDSVEKEINAWATVSEDSHASRSNRGYTITDFRSLSAMSPATAMRAQELAAGFLANDGTEAVEWECETTYLPIWEGDVVELIVPSGDYAGPRKCLVKSLELAGAFLDMSLTLKEVSDV